VVSVPAATPAAAVVSRVAVTRRRVMRRVTAAVMAMRRRRRQLQQRQQRRLQQLLPSRHRSASPMKQSCSGCRAWQMLHPAAVRVLVCVCMRLQSCAPASRARLKPPLPVACHTTLTRAGKHAEIVSAYRAVLSHAPADVTALTGLAAAQLEAGRSVLRGRVCL
jgi:hypothetical protein